MIVRSRNTKRELGGARPPQAAKFCALSTPAGVREHWLGMFLNAKESRRIQPHPFTNTGGPSLLSCLGTRGSPWCTVVRAHRLHVTTARAPSAPSLHLQQPKRPETSALIPTPLKTPGSGKQTPALAGLLMLAQQPRRGAQGSRGRGWTRQCPRRLGGASSGLKIHGAEIPNPKYNHSFSALAFL